MIGCQCLLAVQVHLTVDTQMRGGKMGIRAYVSRMLSIQVGGRGGGRSLWHAFVLRRGATISWLGGCVSGV